MSDVLRGERWRVDEGDCLTWLRGLPDESVQCCVTSPPYWQLRSYLPEDHASKDFELGQEPTPDEYVANMVAVFAEVKRVLRPDGCCFVNVGDSYARNPAKGEKHRGKTREWFGPNPNHMTSPPVPDGVLEKSMCLVPERLGLAFQQDGWIIRNRIVWAKGLSFCPTYSGSVMPSSVRDRFTVSEETIWFMVKSPRYWFDQVAVREPAAASSAQRISQPNFANQTGGAKDYGTTGVNASQSARKALENYAESFDGTRNCRSVWAINPSGSDREHYAAYPEVLIEPMILAASSDRACSVCGAPWQRVVEKRGENPKTTATRMNGDEQRANNLSYSGVDMPRSIRPNGAVYAMVSETLGFAATCACDALPVGSIVMDPFLGSGTTVAVALKHGRRGIGCELSPKYAAMSRERIAQAEADRSYIERGLVPPKPEKPQDDRQASLFGSDTEPGRTNA